jgi:hypothetical protein
MGPKKASPVKDAKVAKKTPTKKAAATTTTKKTPATTKTTAAAKTPVKTPAKKVASRASGAERKYIKAACTGIDAKDAQAFATYRWSLYLQDTRDPIAVVEGAMPLNGDAFWCSQTGPVFGIDLQVTGKDGHRFVWKY